MSEASSSRFAATTYGRAIRTQLRFLTQYVRVSGVQSALLCPSNPLFLPFQNVRIRTQEVSELIPIRYSYTLNLLAYHSFPRLNKEHLEHKNTQPLFHTYNITLPLPPPIAIEPLRGNPFSFSVGARSRGFAPPSIWRAALLGRHNSSFLAEKQNTDRIEQPVKAAPFQGAPPSAAHGLDSPLARRCKKSVGSEGMSDFRLSKGMGRIANATQPRSLADFLPPSRNPPLVLVPILHRLPVEHGEAQDDTPVPSVEKRQAMNWMEILAAMALFALFRFLGSSLSITRAELLPMLPWVGGIAAVYLGFRLLRARARRIEASWSAAPLAPPPDTAEKTTSARIVAACSDNDSLQTTSGVTAGATCDTETSVEAPPSLALPIPLEQPCPATAPATPSPALFGAKFCWTAFWAVLAFPFLKNAVGSLTGSWETIRNAPGDILGGGLKDISSFSPYFGLALLALALGFIFCRVRAKPTAGGTFLRARLLLLLIAVIGAAVSVRQIAFIADDVFRRGGVEIPADDTAFRATMVAELSRAALFTDFDKEMTAELDAGNVERARILLAAADLLGRTVSPAVRARYEKEADFWSVNSVMRNSKRCFDGGIRREAETITHIACMIAVDFVPVPWVGISTGDALDLGFQFGNKIFYDEPIDPTIAGLAAVGMAIDLLFSEDDDIQHLQPAVSAVKAGIRTSKRLKMAPRVETGLRRLAGNMFDAESVRHISPFNLRGTLGRAFRKDGLIAARPVLDDLYGMYRHTGYAATPLLALKHADDLAELPHYRRMARLFGKKTDGVIELIGKSWKRAFWKAGKAGAKATAELAVWYAGLAASLTAFLIALSTSASAWVVKRLTLRMARQRTLPPA